MSDLGNNLRLKEEYLTETLEKIVGKDKDKVKRILEKMFNKEKTPLTINNNLKFEMYFDASVNTLVDPLKFEKMFDKTISDNSELLHKLEESKQVDYLVDYLVDKKIKLIGNEKRFNNFLSILLFLYSKEVNALFNNKIDVLLTIEERNEVASSIFEKDFLKEYNRVIYECIVGNYSFNLNNYLRFKIIDSIRKKESNNLIYTKDEWLVMMKECLDNQIKKDQVFTNEILEILKNCIIDINDDKGVYDGESAEKVKALLLENPKEYFKYFVILGMTSSSPEWNTITEYSLWKEFFSDPVVFKKFINKPEYDSYKRINTVRNFWALYENNGYNSIEFLNQGNVQKKIDNELVEERKLLDKILVISEDIETIREELQPLLSALSEITREESRRNYFNEDDFKQVCLSYDLDDKFMLNSLIDLNENIKELNKVDKNGDEVYYLNIELLRDLKYYEMRTLNLMDVRQLDKIIEAVKEAIEEKKLRNIISEALINSHDLESRCYNSLSPELSRFNDGSFDIDAKHIAIDVRKNEFYFTKGVFYVSGWLDSDTEDEPISFSVKDVDGKGFYDYSSNGVFFIKHIILDHDLVWTDDNSHN